MFVHLVHIILVNLYTFYEVKIVRKIYVKDRNGTGNIGYITLVRTDIKSHISSLQVVLG